MPLFARKSAEDQSDPAPAAVVGPKGRTLSKAEQGKVTPKRVSTVRRTVGTPPADRREAARNMRSKMRDERAESRRGMINGEEQHLMARDRGPERRMVRNLIDARRNIGPWFFFVLILVMLVSFARTQFTAEVYLAAELFMLLMLLAVIVDAFLISRRIRVLVADRFPDTGQKLGSLYFYGVMRSISPRFMRTPKPQVKPGQAV